ncbi:MAG TPA: 50S ribosomal protein L21 [Chondromyces sp.]|nr:50S ribosomal protein L21 [Chondromyces sp.]
MTDYAIVEHGGKQYRVSPGDELLVERTQPDLGQGDALVFERVMLVSQGDAVRVGRPTVEGALVRGQVVAAERGDKIIVFKKKRRKGYKKTQGHRQDYYRVRVETIEA